MPRYRDLGALQEEFAQRKGAIRKRVEEFSATPAEAYFYELAYCLLTPQSSARDAALAVAALEAAGFRDRAFDPAPLLHQPGYYIRFHVTKGKRLVAAKAQWETILHALAGHGADSRELRAWLVHNVQGLGWKEASHFLRNIGHRNLAILDRHILRNLKRHGVLGSLPASFTPKRYLAVERAFGEFARRVGVSMDELDLLFWSRETGDILK